MSSESVIKTFNKAIDRVLAKQGTERWKEAQRLWLAISPVNREFHRLAVEQNKRQREMNQDKFGQSDDPNSSFRHFMGFPKGSPVDFKTMLEMVDPQVDAKPEFYAEVIRRHSAMDRLGEADEVAEAVAWLLSDAASFVSGAALPIQGGDTTPVG